MRLLVTIGINNPAFDGDNLGSELARILRDLANQLADTPRAALAAKYGIELRDVHGNHVGSASIDKVNS